ncbi:hypothetical protein [Roseinatronobacter alkalisoli]|uniref:Uncharacterized protein n=1 Tax=Roseinatronobacter alkalisoli TaxID=3028235 RepID=A0ABT5TDH8_9RHOB|nr:hypothetical protein [Roseinatronobacter sp. HJB301]MDD7972755.1 hypothetical protein [Roseinatronobacter sp. HJB301]
MFTRSAIFRGRIHDGMKDAFYDAVRTRLLPAWQQMLHAQAVRLYHPLEAEQPGEDVFLVQEIDYPTRDAIAQALASDRRLAAMDALASVRHMYEGSHYHIIYQRL